ncbi:hypothetical protein SESBI_40411 [Sesbania bispinosa]|nr:hypothetical protein SESBI_40411 [Sesbania bispinosa]
MARRRLKLAYISNDVARKATYNKRKKGIIKKVSELTTLCGIPACAIISSPFDSETEVWPNPEGAKKVIEMYKNASVIDERKNVNQESFLMQMIDKAQDHQKKVRHDNREKELTMTMLDCMRGETLPNMPLEDANDLNKLIDKKLKEIEINIAKLN